MAVRDVTGKRGESLVVLRLTNRCGNPAPYFDPHPLGEKCATYDYLVELVTPHDRVPYFFAQVKTTRRGRTKRARRLRTPVDAADVRRMGLCPVPTYVFSVDEVAEEVYIVGIRGRQTGAIASIPSGFPLDCDNLKRLYDEVTAYWLTLDPAAKTSAFSS